MTSRLGRACATFAVLALLGGATAVRAQSRMSLSATIGYLRDGNYAQSAVFDENVDQATAGFHLSAAHKGRKNEFTLEYIPSVERKLDDPQETSDYHHLWFQLESEPGRRSHLSAFANLLLSPRTVASRLDQPGAVVATRRSDQFNYATGFEVGLDVSRRSEITAAIVARGAEFDDPGLQDSRGLDALLGHTYRLSESREWSINGGIRRTQFDDQDVDIALLTTELLFKVDDKSEVKLLLGGYEVDQQGQNSLADGSSGLVGGVSLRRRGRSQRWTLEYRRDVGAGVGFLDVVEIDSAAVRFSTDVGRRLTLVGDGLLSRQNGVTGDGSVRYGSGRIGFDFAFTRRIGVSAAQEWVDQTSDVAGLDDLSFTRSSVYFTFLLFHSGEPSDSPFATNL